MVDFNKLRAAKAQPPAIKPTEIFRRLPKPPKINDLYTRRYGPFVARLDKSYSLCDAISFLVMRQRGLSEALTTDHHFEQEGFVRLLKA